MMSEQICDHIGFFTMDAKSMKQFYIHVLGFESGSENVLPAALVNEIFGIHTDCRFIKLHKDGFMVELFEPLSQEYETNMTKAFGMNHWGFCVSDRAAFVEKLRRQGLTVIEIKRNGRPVYFLVDPDGNRIEIRDYPK
jgi:catechol 2,3-dioxygenase-like lactoylglutathione lyase family enzyme